MKTTTKLGLTFAVLTASQLTFLRNYTPKDRMFTSNEEMMSIAENLELGFCKSEELRYVRNKVVDFYSTAVEDEEWMNDGKRTEKCYQYMDAMMSVTAVIDHIMYTGKMTA